MTKIFKDLQLQNEFSKMGWVKAPSISLTRDLNRLQADILKLLEKHAIEDEDYHVTLLSKDKEYREQVNSLLTPIFQQYLNEHFEDYNILTSNLIIKPVHGGRVPLHQNWTFLDEKKFTSVTLWFCLKDVDEQNGCLWFLDKSHMFFRDIIRGSNIPYFFIKYEDEIKKLMKPIALKNGEMLVFDDSIFHFSDNNKSLEQRIALQATTVPRSADCYLFHEHKGLLGKKIIGEKIEKDNDLHAYTNSSGIQIRKKKNPDISLKDFINRFQ